MEVVFSTNLDEARGWLRYLEDWGSNPPPAVGSDIFILQPGYDTGLTLKVVGHTYVVDVVRQRPGGFLVPTYSCKVELGIPSFLRSVSEWIEWYRRHFK
jgi:hypothetical protein